MKDKHTPGPIEALPYPYDCGKEYEGKWWLKGSPDVGGWRSIATVNLRMNAECDETAANAKRLALCWNMHDELAEALRAMLKSVEPLVYVDDGMFTAITNARAVLTKLEGGDK